MLSAPYQDAHKLSSINSLSWRSKDQAVWNTKATHSELHLKASGPILFGLCNGKEGRDGPKRRTDRQQSVWPLCVGGRLCSGEGSGQVNGLANALGIFSVPWHACSHTHTHTCWSLTAVCECCVHLCVCHLSAPDRFIVEGGSAPRILLRGVFSLLKDSIIVSEDVSELHSCTHFRPGEGCMRMHTCHIHLNKKHTDAALRKIKCNRYPANSKS